MGKIVDARGLTCPHPVVLTKKALDAGGTEDIITIVDNQTALENVSRLVKSQGFDYQVEDKEGEFFIRIMRTSETAKDERDSGAEVAILVTSNLFGQGDEELGNVLMKGFIYSLTQVQDKIKCMIFMNSAVFLTTEGSSIVEYLMILEEQGVEILSCGTCLDYYQLKDKLRVGKVTNMYSATEILVSAAKVLKI
ncbi:MAG: sulfurtransferase-like selenium metabolism protein YedF [Syntrophomonadaceae bacterium]|jgi:selenium metabolism protein YedF